MFFVNVYQFVVASFPFGFEDGIRDFIVLAHDHCPSFYFKFKHSCRVLFLSK